MSHLIALVFDDPYKADEARAALLRLAGEGQVQLEETALVAKYTSGKIRVSQDVDIVARDKNVGHLAGLLTAAVTGTLPFILGGTVAGRLVGMFTDHGVTNRFIKDIKQKLGPGTSCLIVFGGSEPQHRTAIAERLKPFTPHVLESDLPPELEEAVNRVLQEQAPAPKE